MNQSKLLLEALSLSKLTMQRIAYRFGIYKYRSGMGIDKVEHKSLPGFAFFEIKTSKTLSQELAQLHVIMS